MRMSHSLADCRTEDVPASDIAEGQRQNRRCLHGVRAPGGTENFPGNLPSTGFAAGGAAIHPSATVNEVKYNWRNCSFLTNSSATRSLQARIFPLQVCSPARFIAVDRLMIQERTPAFLRFQLPRTRTRRAPFSHHLRQLRVANKRERAPLRVFAKGAHRP